MQMLYIGIADFDSFKFVLINLSYADSFFTLRNKFIYNFIIGCTDFFGAFFFSYGLNPGINGGYCTFYSQSS